MVAKVGEKGTLTTKDLFLHSIQVITSKIDVKKINL